MYRRYGEGSYETPVAFDEAVAPAALVRLPARRDQRPPRGSRSSGLPTVRLHGIEMHAITEARCIDYILDELDLGKPATGHAPAAARRRF